ncbi:MAG: GNAT family N-acetyltransferase [Methanomicrobiaceae archaeon]|nr:GNAT family N-acetyltransferase [Methanomicrobiaceae archaeon]
MEPNDRRNDRDNVRILRVSAWDAGEIADLYREGGWWNETWDPTRLSKLIEGSFLFVVAVDTATGKAIGMGRAISDGVSDAYIQDLVVRSSMRRKHIGRRILDRIVEECLAAGLGWIGCIAEPGTHGFYRGAGFAPLEGHVPLLYGARSRSDAASR